MSSSLPFPTGSFKQFIDTVDPYLLDPIAVAAALRRGHHTHLFGEVEAVFETTDVWETLSLFHTFRKERKVFEDLIATLAPDDVFYDVGANLGAFTCFAGRIVREGTVVAFEPHPDNVARLKRNVELNRMDTEIYECALAHESGSANLSVDLGRAGNQRHSLATDGNGQTISVETLMGDSLVERGELSMPTVVKIDVEGAEMQVIEGLESSLRSETCRVVYCEIHPELMTDYEGTPDTVRRTLEGAGFDIEDLHASGGQSYLRGEKS